MAVCPSCVFGAVASRTLSFPARTIETITVSKIPEVTVYPSGPNVTHYKYVTQSFSEIVGSSAASVSESRTTFSDVNSITWTVGDATLTYPTKYIHYLAFDGAGASKTVGGESCAQDSDASFITLPSGTNVASFIYPLASLAGTPLPTALLDYLGSLSGVSGQLGGENPASCAPLTTAPPDPAGCGDPSEQQRLIEIKRGQIDDSSATSKTPSTNASTTLSSSQASAQTANSLPRSSLSGSTPTISSSLSANVSSTTFPSSTPGSSCPAASLSFASPAPAFSSSTGVKHAPPGHKLSRTLIYIHHTAFAITTITVSPVVIHTTSVLPDEVPRPTKLKTDRHSPSSPPHGPANTANHHSSDPKKHTTPVGDGSGNKAHSTTTAPAVFTFGHTTVTAQPSTGVVIDHHTVHAGQSLTVGSGASRTTFALRTKGGTTHLIVDSTTYYAQPSASGPNPSAVITAQGHTITVIQSGSSIIVQGGHSKTTIRPGSTITFGGQTLSAPPHGGSVIVNGDTTIFSTPVATLSEVVITMNGHTFTAIREPGSIVLEDAKSTATVMDGSAIMFEGQTVSVAQKGQSVVVNGRTIKVTPTTSYTTGASASPSHSGAARPLEPFMMQVAVVLTCLLCLILSL